MAEQLLQKAMQRANTALVSSQVQPSTVVGAEDEQLQGQIMLAAQKEPINYMRFRQQALYGDQTANGNISNNFPQIQPDQSIKAKVNDAYNEAKRKLFDDTGEVANVDNTTNLGVLKPYLPPPTVLRKMPANKLREMLMDAATTMFRQLAKRFESIYPASFGQMRPRLTDDNGFDLTQAQEKLGLTGGGQGSSQSLPIIEESGSSGGGKKGKM